MCGTMVIACVFQWKSMELNNMKYTLNLDANNYVLSIAHTQNDNIELDLSNYDLKHLSCYQLINGSLVLDEKKLNESKQEENKSAIEEQIATLKQELASFDYIGVKISMGVSTKEEYADKIAYTETLREKIRKLEDELAM